MKSIKLIVLGMMFLFAGTTQGQLSVRLNIGTPPQWGPSGYDQARYYYLPDIECYYDVPHSMFIYSSGNRWIHSRTLPARYRNYDLYNGYKVVMNDYRGNAPYSQFREHRMRYARGYRGGEQHSIREHYVDRGRRQEGPVRRMNNRGDDRGHDRGQGRGNEQGHDRDHDNGRGNDRNDRH